MNLIKNNLKDIAMGFVFLLVNLTSVVVVTNVMGLNLPVAFLMVGIGTLIFHKITKNKLPSVLGISGMYIGSCLMIAEKYGVGYALGGFIGAGVIYVIIALLFKLFSKQIYSIIPNWIVSFSVVLIGLSLITIGRDLIQQDLIIGLIAIIVLLIVEFKAKGMLRLFSMPIAIITATLIHILKNGFVLAEIQKIAFTMPKFNLEAFLTISLIAFAVMFEAIGDCQNTSDIVGFDVRKEVGLDRILFANGIASIISGFIGAAPNTTYSEHNSGLLLTGYKNPKAEKWTAVYFIILAFITPISALLLSIPQSAFGGCLLYLFASVVVNGIKQLGYDNSLATSKKKFIILSVMFGVFYINFTIAGVTISSIAIAMLVGIVLNKLIKE